jgi:hypothetical protein
MLYFCCLQTFSFFAWRRQCFKVRTHATWHKERGRRFIYKHPAGNCAGNLSFKINEAAHIVRDHKYGLDIIAPRGSREEMCFFITA